MALSPPRPDFCPSIPNHAFAWMASAWQIPKPRLLRRAERPQTLSHLRLRLSFAIGWRLRAVSGPTRSYNATKWLIPMDAIC